MSTILYFGDTNPSSTAFHRANALKRLGHTVIIKDPEQKANELPFYKYTRPIHYRSGFILIQGAILNWISQIMEDSIRPDIVWVNSGELFGKKCLQKLKAYQCPIVLYNNDDPTGHRDGRRFRSLIPAIPLYDLCVVMREINIQEFKEKGAKKTLRVFMSYDEFFHLPLPDENQNPAEYKSAVAFIGSWIRNEKRDEFILELIKQDIPVSIWGGRWPKSPYWKVLKKHYKGDSLSGKDYVAAIQGSSICLGLLSKGNRDLHTQRSLEVPYAGGLLCAERTAEHLSMYKEGEEAFFWKDAKECAEICKRLLKDDQLRQSVRYAGMQKVRTNHSGNEQVCKIILNELTIDL